MTHYFVNDVCFREREFSLSDDISFKDLHGLRLQEAYIVEGVKKAVQPQLIDSDGVDFTIVGEFDDTPVKVENPQIHIKGTKGSQLRRMFGLEKTVQTTVEYSSGVSIYEWDPEKDLIAEYNGKTSNAISKLYEAIKGKQKITIR